MPEHVIIITPEGQLRFVYDDALMGLLQEGFSTVTRASYVEPAPQLQLGRPRGWIADLSPVDGPRLIENTREKALQLEREWLINNVL